MVIEDYVTLFNKWYSHYPLKKAKGQARVTFERLNPDEDLVDKMIKAIELQKKEMDVRGKRGLFNPPWKHPKTWLNGECWEDEVDLEVQAETKTDPIELGKSLGIEPRMGESMDSYKQRVLQTRH